MDIFRADKTFEPFKANVGVAPGESNTTHSAYEAEAIVMSYEDKIDLYSLLANFQ